MCEPPGKGLTLPQTASRRTKARSPHPDRFAPRGELHHHAFARPDGDRVVLLWNQTADETVTARSSREFVAAVEYGLDGRHIETRGPGDLQLKLSAGIPRVFRLQAR